LLTHTLSGAYGCAAGGRTTDREITITAVINFKMYIQLQ